MLRHSETACHKIALEIEKAKPKSEQCVSTPAGTSQPRADVLSMAQSSTRDAYLRLMNTAYELAINPTMSLNQFKTMVNVQRKNGVRFISGKKKIKFLLSKLLLEKSCCYLKIAFFICEQL